MASEGLEHLAWDGHAHDLADEAAATWDWHGARGELRRDPRAVGGLQEITLSAEFPCISYAQKLYGPSPDWFIGFNACAAHDDDGEVHWEETLDDRASRCTTPESGTANPTWPHTGTTDPQEPITRVMTPPWDMPRLCPSSRAPSRSSFPPHRFARRRDGSSRAPAPRPGVSGAGPEGATRPEDSPPCLNAFRTPPPKAWRYPRHDLPRVVIVGAGQTGRELAGQLAGERRVVVLDTDPQKLKRLHEDVPGPSVETLLRDGTSALALRDAAGDGAEWVIAATDQDTVNIEVCRVAAELNPRPATIGTLRESHRAGRLRATGAESIARPGVIASQIRNRVERSHQVATSLGLGRGEIREIQVLPTSPAVNVKLRDLGARKWLVAGIYRGDRFVVPDGDAVIEAWRPPPDHRRTRSGPRRGGVPARGEVALSVAVREPHRGLRRARTPRGRVAGSGVPVPHLPGAAAADRGPPRGSSPRRTSTCRRNRSPACLPATTPSPPRAPTPAAS